MSKIWVKAPFGILPMEQQEPFKFQPHVYSLEFSERYGCLLEKQYDSFPVPDKIYDIDQPFIDRVLKQFNSGTDKNLGVLMCGLKGTGKTFTAKMIAAQSGLPIITVNAAYPGIDSFISLIDYDCVIMVDEYEKVFANDDRGILLSCMDGVQSPKGKVLFLLTTNSLRINENLIDRPSRLRYLQRYEGLSKEIINQIVDDLLEHKEFKTDVIDTISEIPNITIDIVMEIIKDVNVHKEPASKFIDYFNCNSEAHASNIQTFDIWTMVDGKKKFWAKNIYLDFKFDAEGFDHDEPFIIDNYGFQICEIAEYTSKRSAIVKWILDPKFYKAVRDSYMGRVGKQEAESMWDRVSANAKTAEELLDEGYSENEEEPDEVKEMKASIKRSEREINFTGEKFLKDVLIHFGPHKHKNYNFRTPAYGYND